MCWGLTIHQPLWVIYLQRYIVEEIVEEMKERDREERGTGMKSEEIEEIKHSPSTLPRYKDSRPCPTASQYQLDAIVT